MPIHYAFFFPDPDKEKRLAKKKSVLKKHIWGDF
jgi:hypothetical protein